MALITGSRLGAYEVNAPIGEGGMGQVWRATDSTLGRQVAIKILPDAFASDPERLARFEREAKTLAALNHPHIAAIYGFEKSAGANALVMELVEGEDLSQRISRGRIPIDEALPIAKQIAEALEAAHEQGIVHRDLKPANIKLRDDGTVKVLDFGLAKALDQGSGVRDQGSGHLANSPTITSPAMTLRGVILGTAAYMAPEQAKAKVVDRRADIWAFGCVCFEMLAGSKPFDGEDTTDILGAIVKTEPDWSSLPSSIPPRISALLRRCLQKDVKKRLQHIGDARLEIDDAMAAPIESAQSARVSWRPWGVAAVMTIVTAAALVIAIRRPAPPNQQPGMLLQYDVPMSMSRNQASLSPDGHYLGYLARGIEGRDDLWLRDLRKPSADKLGAVTNGGTLIWSPDSASLYLTEPPRTMRRFDIRTRSSVSQSVPSLAASQVVFGAGGYAMLADRRLIVGAGPFAVFSTLQVWTPEGLAPLLPLDTAHDEIRQSAPALWGHDRISYASHRADGTTHLCLTAAIEPKPDCAGALNQNNRVFYQDGRIVFSRGGSLLVRGFDRDRVAFTGEEQALMDGLPPAFSNNSSVRFDLSDTGVIALPVGEGGENLVWQTPVAEQVIFSNRTPTSSMALSPDGNRVLTSQGNELYLLDVTTGGSARLGTTAGDPIWAPDGRRFAHRTSAGIVVRSVDDARESVVMPGNASGFPEDWSRDGRWIVVGVRSGPNLIEMLPPNGGNSIPILSRDSGLSNADEMHFSPDGRWLAFNALSGTRHEVFVVPLPPTGQRWQVSSAGGMQARWHPNGRTLYFLNPDGMMMATEIAGGPTFSASVPKALFDIGFSPAAIYDDYRVAPDGRFLVKKPGAQSAIRIIVNWPALLSAQNTP